jgi:mannan endo-1,4-beta-mannosidase
MYRTVLSAVTTLMVAMLVTVANTGSAHAGPVFVTRAGAAFDLGGQPFRFGGTNNYYLHYKSQAMVDDVFSDGGCSAGTDLWTPR